MTAPSTAAHGTGPTPGPGGSDQQDRLAIVVLAHNDPTQVRRLIAALDPFPVFLHCDAATPESVFEAMTTGLPDRCTVVTPRRRCPWAAWDIVPVEIEAYRAALAGSDASHIAVLAGSDYPLLPTAEIAAYLATRQGSSIATLHPLPFTAWGRSGGFARLKYRHRTWRRHMIRIPLPRRIPADVVPAGGAVQKILAREHAAAIVAAYDARPDLVRFWQPTWCADETFIPTLLSTPWTGIDWAAEHVEGSGWWIGWDGTRRKSPPWLTDDHYDTLAAAAAGTDRPVPALFARKFSTELSSPLLDRIDVGLRSSGVPR